MAAAGIGVPPVEGRWDAAVWDGDPAQPAIALLGVSGVGVWDGNPAVYMSIPKEGTLKRAASATVVRGDGATLKRAASATLVRDD